MTPEERVLTSALPPGIAPAVVDALKAQTVTVHMSSSGLHHVPACMHFKHAVTVAVSSLDRAACCRCRPLDHPLRGLVEAIDTLQRALSRLDEAMTAERTEFWKVLELEEIHDTLTELQQLGHPALDAALDAAFSQLDRAGGAIDIDEASRSFRRAQLARIAVGCGRSQYFGYGPRRYRRGNREVAAALMPDQTRWEFDENLYGDMTDLLEEGFTPVRVAAAMRDALIRQMTSVCFGQHRYPTGTVAAAGEPYDAEADAVTQRADAVHTQALRWMDALDRELDSPSVSFTPAVQTIVFVDPCFDYDPLARFRFTSLTGKEVVQVAVDSFDAQWLARAEVQHINVGELDEFERSCFVGSEYGGLLQRIQHRHHEKRVKRLVST